MSETRNGLGPDGVARIAAERQRQLTELGYGAARDDAYLWGELVDAGTMFANAGRIIRHVQFLDSGRGEVHFTLWPWNQHPEPRKPQTIEDRIAHLAKAGALYAAEIDRLLRQQEHERTAPQVVS